MNIFTRGNNSFQDSPGRFRLFYLYFILCLPFLHSFQINKFNLNFSKIIFYQRSNFDHVILIIYCCRTLPPAAAANIILFFFPRDSMAQSASYLKLRKL